MSSKPTVIFVPGAWHGPDAFGLVSDQLKKEGYSCVGVSLPSVGAMPPLKSFVEDVKAVHKAVEAEVSKEHEVMVAVHSYGGIPGCEGVKGFTKADQKAKGQKGGVVKILFICSFVMPEGGSLLETGLGGKPLPWFDIRGDELHPMEPEKIFYNDLDEDTARYWISKLRVHSYPTLSSLVTYPAWQHVPSIYLICEQDNAIPLAAQQGMVQQSGMSSETCSASHSPFLSQPDVVTDFIKRAAASVV